jgi:hypothetical protein
MKNDISRSLVDLILFIGLMALFIYAYRGTHSYVTLHNNSLIHQLDRTFADKLYSAQRQVRIATSLLDQIDQLPIHHRQLDKITSSLTSIEDKYSKNSPGLLFLGPIGTTSIVLKEQELEEQLLVSLNQLSVILQQLVPNSPAHENATSVQDALEKNQEYIGYLLKLTRPNS